MDSDSDRLAREALSISSISQEGTESCDSVAEEPIQIPVLGLPTTEFVKEATALSEAARDAKGLAQALASLNAARARTGALLPRREFHRAIERFHLNALDAAELEARADDEELLEPANADFELEHAVPEAGLDVVGAMLDAASHHRMCTPQEHRELARAMATAASASDAMCSSETLSVDDRKRLERLVDEGRRSFERFVNGNIRLVVSVARQYQHIGLEFPDLIQEGSLGLMRAIKSWDPHLGTQFSTYAYWWIMQTITRAIADKGRCIRLPVHVHDDVNRITKARNQLYARLQRDPNYAEIAGHLRYSIEKVVALTQLSQSLTSLDASVGEEEDSTLGDFVDDTRSESPEAGALSQDRDEALMACLAKLKPRDAGVLRMRFGLGGAAPMTLEQIGQQYGLTRERIRQIEKKALRVLRKHVTQQRRHLEEYIR